MTRGEYRVGTSFNPSGDELVDRIKRKAAELIDQIGQIEALPGVDRGVNLLDAEVSRCKALAMTAIEEGAMWAVKAATKRPPEG